MRDTEYFKNRDTDINYTQKDLLEDLFEYCVKSGFTRNDADRLVRKVWEKEDSKIPSMLIEGLLKLMDAEKIFL